MNEDFYNDYVDDFSLGLNDVSIPLIHDHPPCWSPAILNPSTLPDIHSKSTFSNYQLPLDSEDEVEIMMNQHKEN